MSTTTLHYVHDPLCGWCYGAAPLIPRGPRHASACRAARRRHDGGRRTAAPVTPEFRQFVMTHDRRIAQASGQPFGQAYFEGLLRDTAARCWIQRRPSPRSWPPTNWRVPGLDMLARLQKAHYVEGRRIAEARCAPRNWPQSLGLDVEAFAAARTSDSRAQATQAHIEQSRALLARVGAYGFPTLVLEQRGPASRSWTSAPTSANRTPGAAWLDAAGGWCHCGGDGRHTTGLAASTAVRPELSCCHEPRPSSPSAGSPAGWAMDRGAQPRSARRLALGGLAARHPAHSRG